MGITFGDYLIDSGYYEPEEEAMPYDHPAEIERLQEAKRSALKIADERSKENVALRQENERLQREVNHLKDLVAGYKSLVR